VPVKLNGKTLEPVSLIEKLNKIGAAAGVGRSDCIEDRVVGIKSREIYEAPAAWILYTAHKELEAVTLDKETIAFKEIVGQKYSQLVYQGLWFTGLRQAFDAFIDETQKYVTGKIVLKLYKGNIIVAKRISKNSLYKKAFALRRRRQI
jgi:argininosuccinate synthase